MKDRAGNELAVGDRVLYLEPGRSSSYLVWGTIDRFTAQRVVFVVEKSWGSRDRTVPPDRVVKPFKE